MERVFKIVLRSVDSGGICSGRASGVSPEMYVDGTESIPRCSRAPRKLSSPPEWSLFTCTNTMCLLMVGMRREGTKQGGWERAGRDWVKRPCPNTATSKVAPEGSLPTFHGGALAPPRELGWGSSPQEAAVRFVRDGLHIQVQFRRKLTPGTTRTK